MNGIQIVLLGVVGGLGVLAVIFTLTLKAGARQAQEVMKKFSQGKILGATSQANFFGQESLGMTQIRGNGVLVLTYEELYFEMMVPKKILRIPLSCINGIEIVKSFLGKSKFRPLLKVIFINEQGRTDSAAWLMKDVEHWKTVIEKLLMKQQLDNREAI